VVVGMDGWLVGLLTLDTTDGTKENAIYESRMILRTSCEFSNLERIFVFTSHHAPRIFGAERDTSKCKYISANANFESRTNLQSVCSTNKISHFRRWMVSTGVSASSEKESQPAGV
jgi:hypothetical protein